VVPPARQLVVLARFGDAWSADLLVAFLANRGVDAYVEGADPLAMGLGGRIRVVLAEEDVRRARWAIEAQTDITEGEMWFLATGALDSQAARRALAARPEQMRSRARRAAGAAGISLIVMLAAALIAR